MARPATFTYVLRDYAAICAYQTTGAAGNLTINGTYADMNAAAVGVGRATISGSFQRAVTLNCSSDVSTVTFTVYGIDTYGRTVSEALSGPNASVVTTTQQFWSVTRVAADAAVASNTRVGIGDNGSSRPWKVNVNIAPVNIEADLAVTATATTFVQSSSTDIEKLVCAGNNPSAVTWFNNSTLSGVTASTQGNFTTPVSWVRATVSGANGTGVVQMILTQAGIRN